jgi:myosin heavy subunit
MKDNDIDDANQFKVVKHAMDVITISDEEQAAIFSLIASVLHLGNVGFSENDNGIATITGPESLGAVAKVSLTNFWCSNLICENLKTKFYIFPVL